MTTKFKKYDLVQFCEDSQNYFRDFLKHPDLAESKGVVLECYWEDRSRWAGEFSTYIYKVELTTGEIHEIAEAHLEGS